MNSELQIRGGIEDNSEIIFLIPQWKHICCDPALEPSRWDDIGYKIYFIGVLWEIIPTFSFYPFLCGSTVNWEVLHEQFQFQFFQYLPD